MTIAFFAMIGMAVDEDKVPNIKDAIADMAKGSIKGPYIISFGGTPDSVYKILTDELEIAQPTEEGVTWQWRRRKRARRVQRRVAEGGSLCLRRKKRAEAFCGIGLFPFLKGNTSMSLSSRKPDPEEDTPFQVRNIR
jgi:hypothetical protein